VVKDVETRTYEITDSVEMLDQLEELLRAIEILGNVGSSREISLYVDSDGTARYKIKRLDKDIELKDSKIDIDNDKIDMGLC